MLRVEGSRLLGRRGLFGSRREIPPDEIEEVEEEWWPSPSLHIATKEGWYRIGALSNNFEDVIDHIESNTPFAIRTTALHRYIWFWYGRWIFRRARKRSESFGQASGPGETDLQGRSAESGTRIPLRWKYPRLGIAGIVMTAAFAVAGIPSLGIYSGRSPDWMFLAQMVCGVLGIVMVTVAMRTWASRKVRADGNGNT